jgi:glycosyltransferase involved in cell wall biosynthesis
MKPRVLLIPNESWWVIGEMGREIISALGDEFDFFFWPERLCGRRPDLFRYLLENVHAVHALNESSMPLILESGATSLPPIVSWIHHVTEWSTDHQAAVDHSRTIVCCTPDWAANIRQLAGRELKTQVVLHGINPNFFRPRPAERARFGIPPGVFSIGFSANHKSNWDGQRKGIPVLLTVLERLHNQQVPFHLSITGSGWEEEVRQLRQRGIPANSLGFLPRADIPVFYSTIDAFLMTSSVEGGPLTVLESMACGTPAVATRVGLVPDVIRDGVSGFSTPVGAVEELTEALKNLALSPTLRQRMSAEAIAVITKNRTWKVTMEPLRRVYRDAIGSGARNHGSAPDPGWMSRPDRFLEAACTADALLLTIRRYRLGENSLAAALSGAHALLEGMAWADRVRGAAMLSRMLYRIPPPPARGSA